jgi:hypothetical protein
MSLTIPLEQVSTQQYINDDQQPKKHKNNKIIKNYELWSIILCTINWEEENQTINITHYSDILGRKTKQTKKKVIIAEVIIYDHFSTQQKDDVSSISPEDVIIKKLFTFVTEFQVYFLFVMEHYKYNITKY